MITQENLAQYSKDDLENLKNLITIMLGDGEVTSKARTKRSPVKKQNNTKKKTVNRTKKGKERINRMTFASLISSILQTFIALLALFLSLFPKLSKDEKLTLPHEEQNKQLEDKPEDKSAPKNPPDFIYIMRALNSEFPEFKRTWEIAFTNLEKGHHPHIVISDLASTYKQAYQKSNDSRLIQIADILGSYSYVKIDDQYKFKMTLAYEKDFNEKSQISKK